MEHSCRDYCFTGFTEAVVLDVETTGLEPTEDRVVSVAALKFDFPEAARTGEIKAQTFSARINPECPIPPEATAIHGIEDHHVADAKRFPDIAQGLRGFIGDLPIVGHNIQFDKRFLSNEFKRAGMRGLGRTKSFCTLKRTKEHLGYTGQGWRYVPLDEVAKMVKLEGRKGKIHDAMEDALLTSQIAVAYYIFDNGLRDPLRSRKARERDPKGSAVPRTPTSMVVKVAIVLVILIALIAVFGVL